MVFYAVNAIEVSPGMQVAVFLLMLLTCWSFAKEHISALQLTNLLE